MKNKTSKILIIALVLMLALAITGCDAQEVWAYFSGNFPEIPEVPPEEIFINQGNVETQTGGLADIIESIQPTVFDTKVVYHYNAFANPSNTYQQTYKELAVAVKKTDNGVYFWTAMQGVKDKSNTKFNGIPYLYSRVEITVMIGNDSFSANRTLMIEEVDSALLFVSKSALGDNYQDIQVAKLPEIFSPREGETLIAFSNPYGVYQGTVTKGILSSVREVEVGEKTYTLIQTDAALNMMSSGIVFNGKGELMGFLFAKATGDYEGLSFVMPVNKIVAGYHEKGYFEDILIQEV